MNEVRNAGFVLILLPEKAKPYGPCSDEVRNGKRS